MSRVFVSYRRDDTQGEAGHLLADLRRRFGDERVFMDIAGIGPGEEFGQAIERAIAGCSVILVLIGRTWIEARDAQGQRRLNDPNDWVRLEVQAALQGQRLVIPVLVQGAAMPAEHDLPESMRPLARRNAHEMSARRWDFDFDSLAQTLETALGMPAPDAAGAPAPAAKSGTDSRQPARLLWPVAAIVTVALALGVYFVQGRSEGTPDTQSTSSSGAAEPPSSSTPPKVITKGFLAGPSTGDFEKTSQFADLTRLSAELAAEDNPSEDQLRKYERVRNAACVEANLGCQQAVLLKVRSTLESICRRRFPDAAKQFETSLTFKFQSCVLSMQNTMTDEMLRRGHDIRSIKAG